MTDWRCGGSHAIRIEDVREDDRHVVRAELPGIDPERDVEITVAGGMLRISGERREGISDKGRSEFHYRAFFRSVPLPKGADDTQIDAGYHDGILEVTVPMTAALPQPRSITVSRS